MATSASFPRPRPTLFECFRPPTVEFEAGRTTNGAGGEGTSGIAVGQFDVPIAGDYQITHTGDGVNGNAFVGVSTTALTDAANTITAADVFDSTADRIDDATPTKTYVASLPAGTLFVGVGSGGGDTAESHDVVIEPLFTVARWQYEDRTVATFIGETEVDVDVSQLVPCSDFDDGTDEQLARFVERLCALSAPARLDAAAGTLPDGSGYTIASDGTAPTFTNGQVNWVDSDVITLTFDNPTEVTIGEGLPFWQLFNGARTSVTTNGDPLDASDFTGTNVTITGQTATYAGGSSNGQNGWGQLVAANATEIVIQGVGNDALTFTVPGGPSPLLECIDVKAAQNVNTGHICFGEQLAGALLAGDQLPSTSVVQAPSDLLGGANTLTDVAEWVADQAGTIETVSWLHSQLQANNAGSGAEVHVTNVTTGDTGVNTFNPGTLGVVFGDEPTSVTRTLVTPVPVAVGDVVRVAFTDNNGNSWGLSSSAGSGSVWLIDGQVEGPSIGLAGQIVESRGEFAKQVCTATGDVTYVDTDGNEIDTSTWTEIACFSDEQAAMIERLIEDDCKLVGNFTERVFNETGVVNRFDFNPNAAITLDSATVTQADIEAFFDGFDYSATPDATSTTNSLDVPDAFPTSANPGANVSFLQGFLNVTQPTTIRLSNTNQWAGRVEIDENGDGNYVTLITHYNGPGTANSSSTEPLPEGIIGIRITSFDYDGVNGNIVTNLSEPVLLSNVEPTKRCFIGKRLDGETDVVELATGLIVPGAEFDTCSTPAAPVAVPANVVICEPFDLEASFIDDSATVALTWTPAAVGVYSFDFLGETFEADDTVSLQVGTSSVNDVYDGTGTPLTQAAPSQTGLTLTVSDLVEHTFTLTAAGTTAFNEFFNVVIRSTSCPTGSLDLSAFRNVATADLVADANHEHDFAGFRQVWDNVGEFEVRAVAEGFSDGRAVLVSTADDGSNSAAVRATSSSALNGTEARVALTARDASFDENSVAVSESRVAIRVGDSGVAGSVFTIEGIPAYADQAAAVAAGAQGTSIYQTDGTGAAPLNVPGILMVVQ